MPRIAHLHDERIAGEKARYLAFLTTDAALRDGAEHRGVAVPRFAAGLASVDAEIIVSHLPLCLRTLPGLLALRARHPRATLVHVEHDHCEGSAVATRNRARLRATLRSGYRLFDHVLALGQEQAGWLRRHELVSPGQLSVAPPCTVFGELSALPAPASRIRRIGAIGRLHRQNGFDILIEAFGFVSDPEARLDIHGDGPQRAELRALARQDPRIRLLGNSAHCDALRLSDTIAIPARWQPSVLLAQEARAAGRRLLHSGRDGLADLQGPGVVSVADLSVAAWSRALSDALTETAPAPRLAPEPAREASVKAWQSLLDRLAGQERRCRTALAAI